MAASRTIPPPPPEVLEHIRRHHQATHDRDLDPERDIYTARGTPPGAIYDWDQANPKSGARFHCQLCGPGFVGIAGEPPRGTPERRAFLRLNDPHLHALLAATPPERHDGLTDAYDHRELGPAMLASTQARKRRQTAIRHHPDHQRRLDGFRTHFLDAYASGTSIDGICEALEDLFRSDLDAYRQILGSAQPRTAETFRSWVYLTTTGEERDQARAQAKAAKETRRAARGLGSL